MGLKYQILYRGTCIFRHTHHVLMVIINGGTDCANTRAESFLKSGILMLLPICKVLVCQ